MTSWLQPYAKWASLLYRTTGEHRVDAILRWLKKSSGWLSGLQTILPQPPGHRKYTKWMLAKTASLEIWLFCWGPNVRSSPHEYLAGEVWSKVISGILYERTGDTMRKLCTGDVGYHANYPYQIITLRPAYSIHICTPDAL